MHYLQRIIATALAGAGATAYAASYSGAVTGVRAHDEPGGSGGYSPGYVIETAGDRLNYRLADGDRIDVHAAGTADFAAVALSAAGGALPVTLNTGNGTGALAIAATRPLLGSWGVATGIDVDRGNLVIAGRAAVRAQADDAVPNSAALGVRVRAGSATFQGAVDVTTYTPGYSQGLWVYQGAVDFNGPATILAQARGESTSGVYNSGGGASRITFNQTASIAARAIYPSDNVHGIYNDNQNSRLHVAGALDVTAVSHGSTAFGLRNQGYLTTAGNAAFSVTGPRSTFGIANTHRSARMAFGGDVTIAVTNTGGYVPFGNPTGIGNGYPGTSSARFDGALSVDISATTEVYAVDNASLLQFTSPSKAVSLRAASSCASCEVYGVRNWGGTVQATGGIAVVATASDPGRRHAIWNVATGGRAANVSINEAGGQAVQLVGDIVTGATAGETATASTQLVLAGGASFLRGGISGYRGADNAYLAGATTLRLAGGAQWRYEGALASADFGHGALTVEGTCVVDVASLANTALTIDSSHAQGAAVTLADGAVIRIATDVRSAQAGRVAFGAGIVPFAAAGTLRIAVGGDPLLHDGTLAGSDTVYPIDPPIAVVDASMTPGDQALFAAVEGIAAPLPATAAGTPRTAIVQPVVALSADRRRVLLSGLHVLVLPDDTLFRAGFEG